MMRIKDLLAAGLAAALAAVMIPLGIGRAERSAGNSGEAAERSELVQPLAAQTASENCTLLGLQGKYITDAQNALDRINEIRLEACREGIKNPANGAALTLDDYVPMKWSAGLEYIARVRAAEAGITIAHERLNGKEIWSVTSPDGTRSYGECLAWNYSESMLYGIEQWYGEKNDWINNTGKVTGHYTAMISPKNISCGLATFYSKSLSFPNSTAAEFSSITSSDEAMDATAGDCVQPLDVSNELLSGSFTLSVSEISAIGGTGKAAVTTAVSYNGGKQIPLVVLSGVTYSSSDDSVVSVDGNGVITAKKCGEAKLTASAPNGAAITENVSVPHTYGDISYSWAGDFSSCTAKTICAGCQNEITASATVTKSVTAAKCETAGKTVYTAKFSDPAYITQTKEIAISPLGHDYASPSYTWSSDCSSCTVKETCKSCKSTRSDQATVKAATTAASCTKTGKTVYTATFANAAYEKQTKTVSVPALGHSFGKASYTWSKDNKTCTASRTCSVCKTVEKESSAATISASGSKTVYTATFRNNAFTKKTKTITSQSNSDASSGGTSSKPSSGSNTTSKPDSGTGSGSSGSASHTHAYGAAAYNWSADKKTCTASRACSLCGAKQTETVSASSKVTLAATYFAKGKKVYTASFTSSAFKSVSKTVSISKKKPSAFKVRSKTSRSVVFKWKKVEGATSFKLQSYDEQNKKWKTVKTVKKGGAVSCKATGLAPATSYKFRLKPYKGKTVGAAAVLTVKTNG